MMTIPGARIYAVEKETVNLNVYLEMMEHDSEVENLRKSVSK